MLRGTTKATPEGAAVHTEDGFRPLRDFGPQSVVTGEAVELELPKAALVARIAAKLIDLVLYTAGFVCLALTVSQLAGDYFSSEGSDTAGLVLAIGCYVIAPATVETLWHGRSLGKLIFKLRVVRDDGGPAVFRQHLIRALVGYVDANPIILLGAPGIISSAVNKQGKRLGDLAAGTYVVREETSLRLLPPPTAPPGLAWWAQQADIAPLPSGLALGIRQFLVRSGQFSPAAHQQIGVALLQQVAPFVAPAPPAGAPVDSVLAAILSERRRRDLFTLESSRAQVARSVPRDPLP
jgi:uncharacterized RDD family membrane protein YckC